MMVVTKDHVDSGGGVSSHTDSTMVPLNFVGGGSAEGKLATFKGSEEKP